MTDLKAGGKSNKSRKLSPWIRAATEYYPTVKDTMSYSDMLKSSEFRKYYEENHKNNKNKSMKNKKVKKGGDDAAEPAAEVNVETPADAATEPAAETPVEEETKFVPPPLERQEHIKSDVEQLKAMGEGAIKSAAEQLKAMGEGAVKPDENKDKKFFGLFGGKKDKKGKKNSRKTKKSKK